MSPWDISSYRVSMPKRDLRYRPPVPAKYVLPRSGRGKKSVARGASTAGASSSAHASRQRSTASAMDAPVTFTRREKKSLFKMCQSIQKRQIKDVNRSKASHRAYIQRQAERKHEPVRFAPEDQDSEVTDYSFPLANWRFDEDDDAASGPPVV